MILTLNKSLAGLNMRIRPWLYSSIKQWMLLTASKLGGLGLHRRSGSYSIMAVMPGPVFSTNILFNKFLELVPTAPAAGYKLYFFLSFFTPQI